jgi:hypothetical protein
MATIQTQSSGGDQFLVFDGIVVGSGGLADRAEDCEHVRPERGGIRDAV